MIKGITVVLYEKTPIDTDPFGQPIYEEIPVFVDNVLVAPVSSEDIISDMNLYGKKAVYQLGIPKGDTHEWENAKVSFFGQDFKTFGKVTMGIEDMIPLHWNKKIKVEIYE